MTRFPAALACLLLYAPCASGVRSSSANFAAVLDAKAAKSDWKMCAPFPTNLLRTYYFEAELLDAGGVPVHVAVKLIRDQVQPSLQIFVNHVWLIQPSYADPGVMIWRTAAMSEASQLNETIQINLQTDLAYLSYGPVRPELTLKLKDGRSLILANGTYLPQQLYNAEFARRAGLARARFNVGNKASTGAAAAMSNATTANQSLLAARMMQTAALTKAFVDVASFNASDVSAYERDFHVQMAAKGMWNWAWLLVPIYGLFLGPIFGGTSTHEYLKFKRELSVGPAVKIYEKLRCHPLFKSCGGNKLAPKYEPCP